ncbi:hypothetical protein AB6A40_006512 [Gnathostoma spinigerum]|uniref:SAM domain-containing protein n=1 Tax=Gnathostoma spinigerum TaxID=75299 RepID=A0ABD6EIT3_9BILA
MVAKGVPEIEVLAMWLDSLGYSDYFCLFLKHGYDLATVARITPEDLISLGVKEPNHRKHIIWEIHSWNLADPWPHEAPDGGLREWLALINLPEYSELFESQGFHSVTDVEDLSWEDFEDIGITKLGHLKRLGLALKKLKDHRLIRSTRCDNRVQSVFPKDQHNYFHSSVSPECCTPFPSFLTTPPSSDPASTSSFHRSQKRETFDIYSDYSRSMNTAQNYISTPLRSYKPIVQVFSNHCDLRYSKQGNAAMDHNNSDISATHQNLNPMLLVSNNPTQILSDGSSFINGSTKDTDIQNSVGGGSTLGDFGDYPPPPAPLACEGSIRLLRSAFTEASKSSNSSPASTNGSFHAEQIPSANCDCSTILNYENHSIPANQSFSRTAQLTLDLRKPRKLRNVLNGSLSGII